MKLEKIKNNRKSVIIGIVAISLLFITLVLSTAKAKYKLSESIPLAKGTINYELGDFNVIALYQQDGTNYKEITIMPESGYVINEEKSYCNVNGTKDANAVFKTIDGKHVFSNLKTKSKCYIFFDKEGISVDDIIVSLNSKDTTPNFSQVATTDEGVYQIEDGMYGGTTYYWRGAATTNYVKFADFCWRIIRINGDNSIRLIYDGTTCHANGENTTEHVAITNIVYNVSSRNEYVGWTYETGKQRPTDSSKAISSNLKTQTETWYNNNLGNNTNYASKVTDGKFCNDRNATYGYNWTATPDDFFYYAANNRLITEKSPTISCSIDDIYQIKAGAITADEVSFAGGVYAVENNLYYLYTGNSYWTITPNYGYSNLASVFNINPSGSLFYMLVNAVNNTTPSIRPVINLRSDVTFESGGNGTQSNPYIVQ